MEHRFIRIFLHTPILPVYFYTHAFLIQPNVKGWYPGILDHHAYKYVRLE